MSYFLPHLTNGIQFDSNLDFIDYLNPNSILLLGRQVDQAILSEEDRVVVIRFGHDWVSINHLFM